MAKNASYDKNKDYYQILGISNTATTGDVLRAFNAKIEQLNADLKKKKITGEEYQAKKALLSEAADILSNAEVRAEYDRDRKALVPHTGDNQRTRVVDEEEAEETAKKGRGCLIPLACAALVILVMAGTMLGNWLSNGLGFGNNKGENPDPKPGIETTVEDEKKDPSIKNFGDPRDEKQVAERVEAIQAQLQDLGVVNPQTGVAYTDEELKAIIQFVNGAYLPEKEADAYTMVDETLNFYAGIISAPKTLNMVQYQANSDVVTEDIVRKDIQECPPFDYSLLLMGDSYCYEVIEYFNGMYAKLLSTTDRAEFKNIHNALYKSLADFMYGDGLVLGDRTYRLKDLEGLQNQNDAAVLNALMYNIPVFHVEGVQQSFTTYYSQAGDIVVPMKEIDEQYNALCSTSDYRIGEDGLVYITGESNFATITQTQMINSALQNYQLGNTDAYANGYQYTIKQN